MLEDRKIWHEIRNEVLSNMNQTGPNLFSNENECVSIYTHGEILTLKTLINLVSQNKNNQNFKLPFTIIIKPNMTIDDKCSDYINIMKKELKITRFNRFNS